MKQDYTKTFCNPVSFPDYFYAGKTWFPSAYLPVTDRWHEWQEAVCKRPARAYRTMADPDIMFYDGKWYLYGSMDCCYVSSDLLHWEMHSLLPKKFDASGQTKEGRALTAHEISLFEIFVALTVVHHNGRFYMVHSSTNCIYAADSPFGPFEKIGNFVKPDGSELWVDDPALFEDDGRLYLFFGCGIETGIQGTELNPDRPWELLCDPVRIVEYRPEVEWERNGARYQQTDVGWIEGCDVFKHNGRYYLTYAANGTCYDTYNLGVYYSDESPLSGYRPQNSGPFCEKREGICRGAGHGCVTEGSDGSLWVFYTSVAASKHMYERRVGMDKVVVDEQGELHVKTTDYPQWAPGVTVPNDPDNGAGLLALNHQNPAWATSAAPGREPFYTTDESMCTWWEADEGDTKRQLIVALRADYNVYASRVLWKEYGYDKDLGIAPGAVQYKIEVTTDSTVTNDGADASTIQWETVLDMSDNQTDLLNDYQTFSPKHATAARLTILGMPKDVKIGVVSFILFGKREK